MSIQSKSMIACHDGYHDTWSIEGGGNTIANLWMMDEETHDRQPFENAQENAKLLASAPELLKKVIAIDFVEALLQRGWSVRWKGGYWEWKDHQGCSGTEYQTDELTSIPAVADAWVRKTVPLRPL